MVLKKPFREAASVFRSGDMEIFHGFGLKHNQNIASLIAQSDANYLVYQAVVEGIQIFTEALVHLNEGDDRWGDIRWDEEHFQVYAEIRVDEEWRMAGKINSSVGFYRVDIQGEDMVICALDDHKSYIASSLDFIKQLSKAIPMTIGLLTEAFVCNEEFRRKLLVYAAEPSLGGLLDLFYMLDSEYGSKDYYMDYRNIYRGSVEELHSYIEDAQHAHETTYVSKTSQEGCGFTKGSFLPEYEELIPQLGSQYLFPEPLLPLSDAIACGDVHAVLFHGPAGTGKTIACKLIAERIGMPIMDTVNCTENLDEFVLGKYIPEGDRIVFRESYVTKAIRDGGAVVFEEINFAKPQYLAFLNSLLDDNGFVRLDNGEVVKRHPNFRFFATMNVGYFGTRELNQALYNRFQTIVEISDLADEAIKRMLLERVPDCAGFVDVALKTFHQIKDKIKREDLDVVISPRNLEGWMRMCKYEDVQSAAEKTIIPIAKGDRELEIDLRLLIKQNCRR